MKALITGASSGIGRDMAIVLSQMGVELILAARSSDLLEELRARLGTNVRVICADLSLGEACFSLYEQVKDENIDILINNAGYGLYGAFEQTPLEQELNMLDLNIRAVHILTKLFLKDFKRANAGYILNVASSAGFMPGPLMSCYYATKAYVLRLTQAVYEELRRDGSGVYIGALCPGPVDTGFSRRANVKFSLRGLKSADVAKYAVKKMFARTPVIVPGVQMKLVYLFHRLLPENLLAKMAYQIQRQKGG